MLTFLEHLLCSLLRHPLIPVEAHDRGVSLVGERCRCARRVESVRVYGGQFPQRRA